MAVASASLIFGIVHITLVPGACAAVALQLLPVGGGTIIDHIVIVPGSDPADPCVVVPAVQFEGYADVRPHTHNQREVIGGGGSIVEGNGRCETGGVSGRIKEFSGFGEVVGI